MILLVMALQVAEPVVAPPSDLLCAEAGAKAIDLTKSGDPKAPVTQEEWKAINLETYYLGRLSGRDPSKRWLRIVVADMFADPHPDSYYVAQMKSCFSALDAEFAAQPK